MFARDIARGERATRERARATRHAHEINGSPLGARSAREEGFWFIRRGSLSHLVWRERGNPYYRERWVKKNVT